MSPTPRPPAGSHCRSLVVHGTAPLAAMQLCRARCTFDSSGLFQQLLAVPLYHLMHDVYILGGTCLWMLSTTDRPRDGASGTFFLPPFFFNVFPILCCGRFNFWGYSTINFFSPMMRYSEAGAADCGRGVIREFKDMVKACHSHGIEVRTRRRCDDSTMSQGQPRLIAYAWSTP